MPSNTSTSIVKGTTTVPSKKLAARGSLKVGDLFRNRDKGRVYMHTGVRTVPPSGQNVNVEVNGRSIPVEVHKVLGYTSAGKGIIGYQAIVVRGDVKPGEDGSVVSFDGAKQVEVVGTAEVSLKLFG